MDNIAKAAHGAFRFDQSELCYNGPSHPTQGRREKRCAPRPVQKRKEARGTPSAKPLLCNHKHKNAPVFCFTRKRKDSRTPPCNTVFQHDRTTVNRAFTSRSKPPMNNARCRSAPTSPARSRCFVGSFAAVFFPTRFPKLPRTLLTARKFEKKLYIPLQLWYNKGQSFEPPPKNSEGSELP